ncbi:MAG: two-component regulator propeller domain-containing protein, partial [Ferruginibacter sp.]
MAGIKDPTSNACNAAGQQAFFLLYLVTSKKTGMSIQRITSLLFSAGFLCLHFLSAAQDIHFNLVARAKDDPGSGIISMAQDMHGFFWFSTEYGMYKYDGHKYTSYHHEPFNINSPADDNIWNIIADREGNIWSTPRNSGLDKLNPVTGTFTHFHHSNNDPTSLASDTIYSLMEDHEGTIWVGTGHGLDRFNSNTNKFYHYANNPGDSSSLSCNVVMKIYEDKQQRIWIGTGSTTYGYDLCGGLNLLDRKTGKFKQYLHDPNDPNSLINNQVRTLFEDSRGNFWVGTGGDGLHVMDRTKGTFTRYQYDSLNPAKLSRPPLGKPLSWSDDFVSFIMEDKDGRIWIGSFLGGINVYDPSTKQCSFYGIGKNARGNLADNQYGPAYKTRDNTLWIGSYGPNLYKVTPYQNVQPHTRTGKIVFCFAEDAVHDLWMGTDHGLIHKESNGNEEMYLPDKDTSPEKNQVIYIEKDNNKFWLVNYHELQSFDPVTKIFTKYHHQPGNTNSLLSDSVTWVKKESDNLLWVATIKGLDLMNLKSGTVKHFQHAVNDPGSISCDSIFSVNIDTKQNLWAGTFNGLNRLDRKTGSFKKYLDKLHVFCTKEDSRGQLWCGTSAGLYKYDEKKDQFLNFSNEFNLTGSSCTGGWLVEDSAHNLWMNYNAGILAVSRERNRIILYSKNQGINANILTPCGYARQNGEILWGDTTGYFKLSSPNLSAVSAPEINLSSFLLNNTPVTPSVNGILSLPLMQTKQIRLNHDQNTFSFEFANIDFISEPEDARLFYTLQNYDDAWRTAGDERRAYYFNLPPGKYIFKVKAYNTVGFSTEKEIEVVISPPWWKSWWAYAIAAIVLGSIVYLVYRNHINQLNRSQATQLNLLVATQESERRRIARDLHDDVGTKLSALKMSLSSLHEEAVMVN